MQHPRSALLLSLALASFGTSLAQAQPALPAFTGDSVYVHGTDDIYDPVRRAIREIEAKSPRRYYVVVLGSTGEWNKETGELTAQLFRQWLGDAQRADKKLDAAHSAVALLAIEQRSISLRAGQTLQQNYGLSPAVMDHDLVQRYFVPAARDGDVPGGLVALVQQLEGRITAQDAATAARRRLLSRNLPIGGAALLLTAVAGGAGIYFWRGKRAFGQAKAAFDEFNLKLIQLMEQCDALKQQHQLLPYSDKDFTEPMTGSTLALYEGVEQKLADLRETWLALMDVRNQVEKLLATTSAVGGENVRQAKQLLKEKGLLPNVEELYAACRRDLETLGNAHQATQAAFTAARQESAQWPDKITSLASAGFTTRIYEEQHGAIDAQLNAFATRATADPIGTLQAVQTVQIRQQEVASRIAKLLELDAAWRKGGERGQEVAAKVAEERAAGLRLDERSANPDEPISAAERSLSAAREALLADRPEVAPELLASAHAAFDGALSILEQVRAARAQCRETTETSQTALMALRESMPRAREQIQALVHDFAADSWRTVADNITKAEGLAHEAEAALAESKSLATGDAQRYLAAAKALDAANARIAESQGLLHAIAVRLQELNALREQCAQQRGTLLDAMRQLEAYRAQHQQTIDDAAERLFAEARQLEDQVVADLDSPRPDWPQVKTRLDRLAAALHGARAAAESDVRDRAAFEATAADAERLAARVGETVRTHTADRPRANQAYRGAVRALEELRGTRGNWSSLLTRAQHAKQDLQNAEQWATEDIRLAAQAAQAIAAAERAVGAARAFVASGIAADSGVAMNTLKDAERLYAAQQYEQAITQSSAAEQSARQALQAAEQAARMRQMQQEAERQRRHAERGGAPVVIPGLPTFTFGGGGPTATPSPPQNVSTSNWSGGGGISTSSWTGGISTTKW